MGVDHQLSDIIFSVSNKTLNQFLEQFTHGVLLSDDEGVILYVNRKLEDILGYDAGEIRGKSLDTFLVPADRAKLNTIFYDALINARLSPAETNMDVVAVSKQGQAVPITLSYNPLAQDGKRLIVCLVQDVSQQVTQRDELYRQAITDALTGLYNRRHYDQRLFQEFTRASRYCRPFSMILIDIDGFKQTNDLYGHHFGDDMLIRASTVFKKVLREGDSIYRYGGDEFAMLLPETSKEGGIEVAERLKSMFVQHVANKEKRVRLSLSIGVSSYPEDGADEASLTSAADRRMYVSKRYGGNMITAYDEIDYLSNDSGLLLRSLYNLATMMEKTRGLTAHGLGHSQGIRTLAIEIAHRMGLPDARVSLLEQAAILHDIGNITIPAELFLRTGPLNEQEQLEIRRHPLVGEEIIDMLDPGHNHPELGEMKRIIGQHHERLDGSGYPRALKNGEIMLEARILAVSDSYHAMISKRPYRAPLTRDRALEELQQQAGVRFDRDVISQLMSIESCA